MVARKCFLLSSLRGQPTNREGCKAQEVHGHGASMPRHWRLLQLGGTYRYGGKAAREALRHASEAHFMKRTQELEEAMRRSIREE